MYIKKMENWKHEVNIMINILFWYLVLSFKYIFKGYNYIPLHILDVSMRFKGRSYK